VVLGVCALLGSLAPTAAWPCLVSAVIWLSCWARGLRFAVACLLTFALCGVLAEGKRGRFRRS
jgi:hypothetical protein